MQLQPSVGTHMRSSCLFVYVLLSLLILGCGIRLYWFRVIVFLFTFLCESIEKVQFVYVSFPFGYLGRVLLVFPFVHQSGIRDLTILAPDQCPSFYFHQQLNLSRFALHLLLSFD